MKELLSFVIPCYNSQASIAGVVRDINEAVAKMPAYDYEVILVNDCSPDGTMDVIREICQSNGRVKGINLSRNFGQHSAIMAGLKRVKGSIIVCLDDDGQTPPQQAHLLIEQVAAGHDVAMARYPLKKHSFFRNLGSSLNERMAKSLIGKPKELFLSSYVAMKRYVADEICSYTFPYPYISGLLLRATKDIVNVDIAHRERETGKSGYTLSKLFALWFNGFTNFSIKPLRIAIVIGIIIAVCGFAAGLYSVIKKLVDPAVPMGWASTLAVSAFVGGIVLVVLGLIGEYVGRIFMGLNQQPQYVIREIVGEDEDNGEVQN